MRKATLIGGIILVCVGLLTAHFYLMRPYAGLSAADCDPVSQVNNLLSPDGEREAIITYQACAGGFGSASETYWIYIRRTRLSENDNKERIFEVQRRLPEVSWPAPRRLAIKIQELSDISLSLHRAYDVEITYQVGEKLQPGRIEEEISAYEASTRDALRHGKTTFTGNPAKDPQALAEAIERRRSQYRAFLRWAAANAENAPR